MPSDDFYFQTRGGTSLYFTDREPLGTCDGNDDLYVSGNGFKVRDEGLEGILPEGLDNRVYRSLLEEARDELGKK